MTTGLNLSYDEIIEDKAYNEGYDAAAKTFKKEYEKLFNAAKDWFQIYESSFGTPDENSTPEYWKLRKMLKMPK